MSGWILNYFNLHQLFCGFHYYCHKFHTCTLQSASLQMIDQIFDYNHVTTIFTTFQLDVRLISHTRLGERHISKCWILWTTSMSCILFKIPLTFHLACWTMNSLLGYSTNTSQSKRSPTCSSVWIIRGVPKRNRPYFW